MRAFLEQYHTSGVIVAFALIALGAVGLAWSVIDFARKRLRQPEQVKFPKGPLQVRPITQPQPVDTERFVYYQIGERHWRIIDRKYEDVPESPEVRNGAA